MKPVVAVVGRPNVGKSTFFNRVTRSRTALVDNFSGVTRDRLYRDAVWNDVNFTLVDTGGFADTDEDAFAAPVRAQIHHAIEEADAVILLFDGKNGLSAADNDLIQILRPLKKTIFYVVNKIDAPVHEDRLNDFFTLGLPQLYPVSAEHGYGMNDLMDDLAGCFPASLPEEDETMIRVAVVGRPNAGKSSLINRILGEDRHVVSPIPGTTRDSIDAVLTVEGKRYCFIDTAGIRRKGKTEDKLEKFSVIKALRSLDRCDVALIVMDALEGITEQDARVAGYAHERGCGCIFLLNKWDQVEKDNKTVKKYYEELRMKTQFLNFAPYLTISALTGQRVPRIFRLIDEVYADYTTRIGTGQLNRILQTALEKTPPPLHQGKRLKFYYASQTAIKPPTFVCFVNYPEAVHFSYHRYLVNQFREEVGLAQTPIRLILRQRTGRIEFGRKKRKKPARR
jgi:GTP-binding protein